MVSPSCCLEYRPTIYFWLILFFFVFPLIGLATKVVTTLISVIFRVLCRVFVFIYLDNDEEEEEEASTSLPTTTSAHPRVAAHSNGHSSTNGPATGTKRSGNGPSSLPRYRNGRISAPSHSSPLANISDGSS